MIDSKGIAERTAKQFFLLALFFVPFSTALLNVFVVLTYLAFVPAFCLNKALREPIKFAPSILAILLFAFFVLGIAWSIAPPAEIGRAIVKYSKLLLIPLGIVLAWRDSCFAKRAMIWFMAGAGVLVLGSYLTRFNLMPHSPHGWWSVGDSTNAVAFKNHITLGILVGFAALVSLRYYFYAMSARARLVSIALGFLFAIPIIFFTQGRTGYVVFFVGLLTLVALRFRTNVKRMSASMLAVVAIFAVFYVTSDNLNYRAKNLVQELENYSSTTEMNSSGVRLSFYRAGLQLIAANPVLGLGTGSFQEGFLPTAKKLWPESHEFHTARHQPHSEIILIGVQLGLAGWIVFFSLIGSLVYAARKSHSFEGDSLLILCVIFVTASFFNSLLWDVTEGYWFALLAGCLYAQARRSSGNAGLT